MIEVPGRFLAAGTDHEDGRGQQVRRLESLDALARDAISEFLQSIKLRTLRKAASIFSVLHLAPALLKVEQLRPRSVVLDSISVGSRCNSFFCALGTETPLRGWNAIKRGGGRISYAQHLGQTISYQSPRPSRCVGDDEHQQAGGPRRRTHLRRNRRRCLSVQLGQRRDTLGQPRLGCGRRAQARRLPFRRTWPAPAPRPPSRAWVRPPPPAAPPTGSPSASPSCPLRT